MSDSVIFFIVRMGMILGMLASLRWFNAVEWPAAFFPMLTFSVCGAVLLDTIYGGDL